MKHTLQLLLMALAVLVSFPSCTKDDDNSSPNEVSNLVQQGKWQISSFKEDNIDETAHFTGYEFTFNSNGSVSAVKAGTTVSGTWTAGTDDSKTKLILNFGLTSPFDELNEDWQVLEKTSTGLKLQHISGGNGGTDYLEFEKI